MAEAKVYSFDLDEVTTALIRQQGLHEGVWSLAFEFSFGAAFAGASKEEARPSAFVQINRLQLVRQTEISEGQPRGVDASEVNPAVSGPKTTPKPRKTR